MSRRLKETLPAKPPRSRSEEHTSELQSHVNLVCRLLLEKKNIPRPWQIRCSTILDTGERRKIIYQKALGAGDLTPTAAAIPSGMSLIWLLFFFFNDTAATEIYTLSLHDALPIFAPCSLATQAAAPARAASTACA